MYKGSILTPKEIETLKEGGKILSRILRSLLRMALQRKTGDEIEEEATRLIKEAKGQPAFREAVNEEGQHYPATICLSLNEEVVHCLPYGKKIRSNDVISIDIGMRYQGLVVDMAWTVYGGKDRQIKKLLRANKEALFKALKSASAKKFAEDISLQIQKTAQKYGFYPVKELSGHGIGHRLHGEPSVYNYFPGEKTQPLLKNLALAIEPIFALKKYARLQYLKPWGIIIPGNLTSHFEFSLVVREKGAEVVTPPPLS